MWLENEIENAKKNHPWRWKWEGWKLEFGEWRYGKMKPTIKKAIDIIHDLLRIGKTTAKDLQISGDVATAKRIKRAIKDRDLRKLKKIVTRGGIYIDENDILGIGEKDGIPFIRVSPEFIVRDRQMFKIIRRYKRRER